MPEPRGVQTSEHPHTCPAPLTSSLGVGGRQGCAVVEFWAVSSRPAVRGSPVARAVPSNLGGHGACLSVRVLHLVSPLAGPNAPSGPVVMAQHPQEMLTVGNVGPLGPSVFSGPFPKRVYTSVRLAGQRGVASVPCDSLHLKRTRESEKSIEKAEPSS